MKSHPNVDFAAPSQKGFTLVELLCVMAIMALLLAVTLPSIEGMNLSMGVGQGGQLFADEVALARQTASARNITVEVRCIKVRSRSEIGYTAIQLWSKATNSPVSRVMTLPEGVAISEDTTNISTLFSTYTQPSPLPTMPTGGPLAGYSYISFTISPSGMVGPLSATTAVPSMTLTSVGVLPVTKASAAALPKNYVLVQLNPLTAVTSAYRP